MRAFALTLLVSGCAHVAPAPAGPTRAERHALRTSAQAAYDTKNYAACGPGFERGGDAYNAACCYALAGESERAFAQLAADARRGKTASAQLEQDTDLTALHPDPRWAEALRTADAEHAKWMASINAELASIFEADQADRRGQIDR